MLHSSTKFHENQASSFFRNITTLAEVNKQYKDRVTMSAPEDTFFWADMHVQLQHINKQLQLHVSL